MTTDSGRHNWWDDEDADTLETLGEFLCAVKELKDKLWASGLPYEQVEDLNGYFIDLQSDICYYIDKEETL